MQTYHFHTTVTKEHEVRVPGLPLCEGQAVTVTVVTEGPPTMTERFPLRALPHGYFEPFTPAFDEDDWNMLRDDPA